MRAPTPTRRSCRILSRPFAVDWTRLPEHEVERERRTPRCRSPSCRCSRTGSRRYREFQDPSPGGEIIADRRLMGQGKMPVDWGMAENLAYASLLKDGFAVRISGRTAAAALLSPPRGAARPEPRKVGLRQLRPLSNIAPNQGDFVIIDSVALRRGRARLRVGYSTSEPNELWCGRRSSATSPTALSGDRPVHRLGARSSGAASAAW